jgi:hypothetical protein
VHKGRAVCCTVGEAVFGRVAGPTGHSHPACAFLTVSGMRDCTASETGKTPEPIPELWMPRHPRESDSPAQMRGVLFLAA